MFVINIFVTNMKCTLDLFACIPLITVLDLDDCMVGFCYWIDVFDVSILPSKLLSTFNV